MFFGLNRCFYFLQTSESIKNKAELDAEKPLIPPKKYSSFPNCFSEPVTK